MFLGLFARFLIGVSHVRRYQPPEHLWIVRPAHPSYSLLEEGCVLAEGIDVGIGQSRVDEAAFGNEFHGLDTPNTRNPNRRVRLLHRPRPGIDILELKMLAIP